MRGRITGWVAGLAGVMLIGQTARAEVTHRIGLGMHYYKMLGDIEANYIAPEGVAWSLTYQLCPMSLVKFEFDLEQLPKKFATSENDVYTPQAYVIVGGFIYAAAGVGYTMTSYHMEDPVFYALRTGLDLHLLPRVHVDVNASYRFHDFDKIKEDGVLKDIGKNTMELGAAVRVEL